jgi:DNA-binding FrmR family transcriptional regulator
LAGGPNYLLKNYHFDGLDLLQASDYILPIPPRGIGYKNRGTMENQNTLRRLKIIEGHLRGVIRMVEEDKYCIDVIRQIQAIDSALSKVSTQILENHLNSCVIDAIQGNDRKERERVLKEITEVFEMSTKV